LKRKYKSEAKFDFVDDVVECTYPQRGSKGYPNRCKWRHTS
jgi:hypothetical protein